MKNIFITSSALIALNDESSINHQKAINFLMSLFNETVKVYTNLVEVTCAAEYLKQKVSLSKSQNFLQLIFNEGGISIIENKKEDTKNISDLLQARSSQKQLNFREAIIITAIENQAIKDVFTFEPIKSSRIVNWPHEK